LAGQTKFYGDFVYTDKLSPFKHAIETAESPLPTMVGDQTLFLSPLFRCTKHLGLGAGQNFPRRVVYKRVGDLREQLIKGEKINNKGSYLLTLMQLEAKNRDLPWALKE